MGNFDDKLALDREMGYFYHLLAEATATKESVGKKSKDNNLYTLADDVIKYCERKINEINVKKESLELSETLTGSSVITSGFAMDDETPEM